MIERKQARDQLRMVGSRSRFVNHQHIPHRMDFCGPRRFGCLSTRILRAPARRKHRQQ